jgi:FxsC-like protein
VDSEDSSGPFFFLSYAHSPQFDSDEAADPDLWISKLYRDLCNHVAELSGASAADVGFMDRELRPGEAWAERLSDALATCHVFVPLYSSRYFTSDACGKEWSAFSRRAVDHRTRSAGKAAEAIIPALWVPPRSSSLPEAALSLQFPHSGVGGDLYAEHGFYGIMKLSRFRNVYETAVHQLARRIVDVAQQAPVAPGSVADLDALPSAFGPTAREFRKSDVLVTVAAPDKQSLPRGRDGYYYGETSQGWNPYRPRSENPLGETAASLITSLGYRTDVGGLEEHAGELLRGSGPVRPAVVLLDPWSAVLPESRELLHRLDGLDEPWVSVVMSWNRADRQTAEASEMLRSKIAEVLPRKLSDARATSLVAARGVPSEDEFTDILPGTLKAAERFYLRYAEPVRSRGSEGY